MTEQGYQGWSNRETHHANLWITNDQALYEWARERVSEALSDYADLATEDRHAVVDEASEILKEWWEEITDPDEHLMKCEEILKIVRDVGAERAINWREIAEGLMEE